MPSLLFCARSAANDRRAVPDHRLLRASDTTSEEDRSIASATVASATGKDLEKVQKKMEVTVTEAALREKRSDRNWMMFSTGPNSRS